MIALAITVFAWLKKSQKIDDSAVLATWFTSEILFNSANSVVSNYSVRLVEAILAVGNAYSGVMNISFCTHLVGTPFFFEAIPTYGVLYTILHG